MFTCNEIRLLRTSRQMKQAQMAKKMGISVQRYSQIETGNSIPDERQKKILSVLGYSEKSARKYLQTIPRK